MGDVHDDLRLTHGFLNALQAGYQGGFTSLNVLLELNYPNVEARTLDAMKPVLDQLTALYVRMRAGEAIVSLDGAPAGEEAERLFELCEVLKFELRAVADQLSDITDSDEEPEGEERARHDAFMAACLARSCYAREHFIKGLVDYGEAFDEPEVSDRWRQHLPRCAADIQRANAYFATLKDAPEKADAKFHYRLWNEIVNLPGLLRTQVNDINVLGGVYAGGPTYDTVGIDDADEAEAWRKLGAGPESAGHWSAFGFTPDLTLAWAQAGFQDAAYASAWRVRGFPLEAAVAWHNAGFKPADAHACASAGITDPQKAREMLEDAD